MKKIVQLSAGVLLSSSLFVPANINAESSMNNECNNILSEIRLRINNLSSNSSEETIFSVLDYNINYIMQCSPDNKVISNEIMFNISRLSEILS